MEVILNLVRSLSRKKETNRTVQLNVKDTKVKDDKVSWQRGFGCVEKINNLDQNFNLNVVLLYVYLDHRKAKYLTYIEIISVALHVKEISTELLMKKTIISRVTGVLRVYELVWFVALSVFAHVYSAAKEYNKEILYLAT